MGLDVDVEFFCDDHFQDVPSIGTQAVAKDSEGTERGSNPVGPGVENGEK
jgi:hypothetical protein